MIPHFKHIPALACGDSDVSYIGYDTARYGAPHANGKTIIK